MNPWQRWVALTSIVETGTSQALFRFAVALVVLVDLVALPVTGALSWVWYREPVGFLGMLQGDHWLVAVLGGPEPGPVSVLFWLGVVAASALCVGWHTRIAAPVTFLCCQALYSLNQPAGGGHDRMMLIALFVLIWMRAGATLSVDCRLRTGRWVSDDRVPVWPRMVIVWNLTLVYVHTGLAKLTAEWLPTGGAVAVYRAILVPTWARADWSLLAGYGAPLFQIGTVLTLLWEITFFLVPLWLWLRASPRAGWQARLARFDVRLVYVGYGLLTHGLMWVLMNLGPFTPIVFAWYLMLFRPDELASAGRWLRARWPAARTPVA